MLRDKLLQVLESLKEAVRDRVRIWDEEEPPIERGDRHKHKRFYFYNPRFDRKRRYTSLLCAAALSVVFLYSAVSLIGYGADYVKSRNAASNLRELYYEELEKEGSAAPVQSEVPTEAPSPTPLPASTPVAVVRETAVPTATPVPRLETVKYPGNPWAAVSQRFQTLRRQNSDIIGWLKVGSLVDEVVVQRDNEYYLNRDYRGYHNINGAIFLDESCDLRTRPYTLMLYGHNMKTGAMFGGLRKYEDINHYRSNPFISFDTMYEDGRYVVFAVGTISTSPKDWRYLNLSWLLSSSIPLRSKAIEQLNRFSVYYNPIEVLPQDQILLLVTCVEKTEERRILAARRLRDGETEESLTRVIRQVRTR